MPFSTAYIQEKSPKIGALQGIGSIELVSQGNSVNNATTKVE